MLRVGCFAVALCLLLPVPAYGHDILSLEPFGEWVVLPHVAAPVSPPDILQQHAGEQAGELDVWFVARIPEAAGGPRVLIVASYRGAIEAWVDSEVVQRFADAAAEGSLALHAFPLGEVGGRVVALRFPRVRTGRSTEGFPLLARPDDVPAALAQVARAPLRRDLPWIVAATVVAVLALVAIVVALVRRHRREHALLLFGAFALVYGVRLLLDSAMAPALGIAQTPRWFLVSALTYLINVPAWMFVLTVFGRGWRSCVLWMTRFFAVFFFVGVVADFVTSRPFAADRMNSVAVLVGGIILIATFARRPTLVSREGRIVAVGVAAFAVFAVMENLRALGIVPWPAGVEWAGFVLLGGALGWVALGRFLKAETELVEIGKELEMARAIQRSILPAEMPDSGRVAVRARYVPMTAVAGDLYDVHVLPDGSISVLVADVSGHGVPAAMVASMVKVAASTQFEESSDPAQLMTALNRILCGHLKREFVTATWLVIHPSGRSMRVCNAGHPPPLRQTRGAVLPSGGFGILLGRFRDARYKAATIELDEGDRILCFTDGITEAASPREEEWGFARLEAALTSNSGLTLDALLDQILAEVRAWTGNAAHGDDLTLVGIDVG